MSVTEQFKALKEEKARVEAELQDKAKSAFGEWAKGVFEKHPSLVAFGWDQYTPYFNDGDACVFSARADDPTIWTTEKDEQHSPDDDEDGVYKYDYLWFAADEPPSALRRMHADVREFLGQFDYDDYLSMFGDHASIKVTRDGAAVDGCDHE